nr:MAG TPA: hypothetical protein [Caudoviricetes sp.]
MLLLFILVHLLVANFTSCSTFCKSLLHYCLILIVF